MFECFYWVLFQTFIFLVFLKFCLQHLFSLMYEFLFCIFLVCLRIFLSFVFVVFLPWTFLSDWLVCIFPFDCKFSKILDLRNLNILEFWLDSFNDPTLENLVSWLNNLRVYLFSYFNFANFNLSFNFSTSKIGEPLMT